MYVILHLVIVYKVAVVLLVKGADKPFISLNRRAVMQEVAFVLFYLLQWMQFVGSYLHWGFAMRLWAGFSSRELHYKFVPFRILVELVHVAIVLNTVMEDVYQCLTIARANRPIFQQSPQSGLFHPIGSQKKQIPILNWKFKVERISQ
jgi:hypothetical protein